MKPKSVLVSSAAEDAPVEVSPGQLAVLLVEDDTSLGEAMRETLESAGWKVTWVTSGADALTAVSGPGLADVVLLDLGLPDMDGLDVCRQIRRVSDVPVIVVTARDEEVDRVVGLELGADDYLGKPVGMRELVARVRAVVRRSRREGGPAQTADSVLETSRLRIDTARHVVQVDGRDVELTPTEFKLLAHLAARPGVVHRRHEIFQDVWGSSWFGSSKTLDVHIASLRRKLGDPALVETVRGVGFRLAP